MIGFYYNCYKQLFATEKILEQVRKFYPIEPIYLVSDNGYNFEHIAKKFNCYYEHSNENILGGRVINNHKKFMFRDKESAKTYLNRIISCINYCKTDYIILLEDDVYINNRFNNLISSDCGGEQNYNRLDNLAQGITEIIKKKYDIKFAHWSLAGGSIINSKSFMECITNTPFDKIDFFEEYTSKYNPHGGNELWHTNDVLLSYLFIINNKSWEPWVNTSKSNIIHPDKRFYEQKLDIDKGIWR